MAPDFANRLNYYLAAFFFNAFPLPQREAGARQTLRYIGEVTGDGFSVLIFPEGVRSETGEMTTFRGGIGMIASRLDLPVVPVDRGVHRILHVKSKFPAPARSREFGAPLRLKGDDYAALAREWKRRCGALRHEDALPSLVVSSRLRRSRDSAASWPRRGAAVRPHLSDALP